MRHHLALASILALSFVPSVASAGLITAPTGAPIIKGPTTPAPVTRPAPPVETVNWIVVNDSGWKLQIGQQYAGSAACGQSGNIFARISPAQNGPWTYRFMRSDGSSTPLVNVPAAPEINGRWTPTAAPFAKEVEDTTILRVHVNEWLVVGFDGKTFSSPTQVEICN